MLVFFFQDLLAAMSLEVIAVAISQVGSSLALVGIAPSPHLPSAEEHICCVSSRVCSASFTDRR